MNSILTQCEALMPYLPTSEWYEHFLNPICEVDYNWQPENKSSFHDGCHPIDIKSDWQSYSTWTRWFLNHHNELPNEVRPMVFLLFQAFQVSFGVMKYKPSSWPLDAFRTEERYSTTFKNPMLECWYNLGERYRPTSKFFTTHVSNPRFLMVMKAQWKLFDNYLHDLNVLPTDIHLTNDWYHHRLPDGRLAYIPQVFKSYGIEDLLDHDRGEALVARDSYRDLPEKDKEHFIKVVSESVERNKLKEDLGLFKKYKK